MHYVKYWNPYRMGWDAFNPQTPKPINPFPHCNIKAEKWEDGYTRASHAHFIRQPVN